MGRRPFMLKTCAVMVGAVAAPAVIASAANAATKEEHNHGMMSQSGADGFVMQASVKKCGTCDLWGGPRRVSKDGKTVAFTGLGWCNNAKCPGFRGMMGPDHSCNEGACWQKWGALG
jgi:hypothetical protein